MITSVTKIRVNLTYWSVENNYFAMQLNKNCMKICLFMGDLIRKLIRFFKCVDITILIESTKNNYSNSNINLSIFIVIFNIYNVEVLFYQPIFYTKYILAVWV